MGEWNTTLLTQFHAQLVNGDCLIISYNCGQALNPLFKKIIVKIINNILSSIHHRWFKISSMLQIFICGLNNSDLLVKLRDNKLKQTFYRKSYACRDFRICKKTEIFHENLILWFRKETYIICVPSTLLIPLLHTKLLTHKPVI